MSFIEAAIISLLFFSLIFFCVEMGRYLLVRAALLKGAQDGVRLAARLPDMDLPPNELANDAGKLARYQAARDTVIARSLRLPHSIGLQDVSAAGGFEMFNPQGTTPASAGPLKVAFLRAGDTYQDLSGGSNATHPTYPVAPTGNYSTILRTHPFAIEMRYNLPLLLPLLGTVQIVAKSMAFREMGKQSNGVTLPRGASVTLASTPTPVPGVPGPTPVPTPACHLSIADCTAINPFMKVKLSTCSCICVFPFETQGNDCVISGGG